MGTPAGRTLKLPGDVKLPDRYLVRRRIAMGGMSSVWQAEDRVLGRSVAIKLLSEPYGHDAGAVLRFKREARAAARLSGHVNVVTIFDVGESTAGADATGGRAFIVMAYLEGGTVADALRAGRVERTEALRWVREAAAALDYAHERGVVHRDIKPANLLLDRGRVLHVADFGIARIATETPITQSGEVLGTAAYLAPERTFGEPATEASDRYSLAVVAFELLVGRRPFEAETHGAQLRQHGDQEVPAASQMDLALPPGVDGVLARGMAKRPADRWPTAAAFAAALQDAAAQQEPGVATRPLPITVPVDPAHATGRSGAAVPVAPGRDRIPALKRRPADAGGDRPRVKAPRATAPAARPRARAPLPGPYRVTRGRRATGRMLAFATLGAVLLAVALVAFANGGSEQPGTTRAQGSVAGRSHNHASRPKPANSRSPASGAATALSTATSTGTAGAAAPGAGASGTEAAATASPQGADALNARGYQLMQAGNYSAAIRLLRRAVDTASRDSLTYAYALYNLGRSLVLSGNPRAAIPILRERLAIPNQTAIVQAELARAGRAAGVPEQSSASAPPGSSPGAPTPPGQDQGNHGNGQGGGAD